jgi:hypothetical protein
MMSRVIDGGNAAIESIFFSSRLVGFFDGLSKRERKELHPMVFYACGELFKKTLSVLAYERGETGEMRLASSPSAYASRRLVVDSYRATKGMTSESEFDEERAIREVRDLTVDCFSGKKINNLSVEFLKEFFGSVKERGFMDRDTEVIYRGKGEYSYGERGF